MPLWASGLRIIPSNDIFCRRLISERDWERASALLSLTPGTPALGYPRKEQECPGGTLGIAQQEASSAQAGGTRGSVPAKPVRGSPGWGGVAGLGQAQRPPHRTAGAPGPVGCPNSLLPACKADCWRFGSFVSPLLNTALIKN